MNKRLVTRGELGLPQGGIMTIKDNAAQLGYAMVELPAAHSEVPPRNEDDSLARLDVRMQELDRQIEQTSAALSAADRQVRAAVEAEDPDQAAASWSEKHRLSGEVSRLEDERAAAEGELRAELDAVLANVRQEREHVERVKAKGDEIMAELLGATQNLLATVHRLADARAELSQRLAAWESGVERVARRRHRWPRTQPVPTVAEREPVSRKWAVYDPDAGKLVETLDELLRLVARWYPSLHTESERVVRFLALPNAAPLPDPLRQELQEAGYLGGG